MAVYTVFKSKWQIVNLCSSKTASLKAFKFSVNVGNNWPFCHVQTQILILNSLGSVKQTKYAQFSGLNLFFLALFEKTCLYQYTDVKKIELELRGWSQMIGNFSEITHLPKKLKKVGYRLRLSLVFGYHC